MSEHGGMSCGEFTGVAAELALGVLTGRERADAVAHLEHCDACRETVRELTMTSEALLGLLPAAEPPAGFETRVLSRIGVPSPEAAQGAVAGAAPGAAPAAADGAPGAAGTVPGRRSPPGHARRSRPVRRRLAVAAAVAGLIAAGAGGYGLRTAVAPSSGSAVASAPLSTAALVSASHQTAGEVFYYDSASPWMYMSVTLPSGDGTVTCEIAGSDGHYAVIGKFRLSSGYGGWGGPYTGQDEPVTARLVNANGTVLATAHFT